MTTEMIQKSPRSRREIRFTGHPISPGIGIGPVFEAAEPVLTVPHRKISASDIAAENARLDEAVAQSRKQLGKLKTRLASLPEQSEAEISPLIDAYLHMLGASRLLRGVKTRISDQLLAAETAMMEQAEFDAAAILAMPDADQAGRARRADEVREIARRVVRNLTRLPFRNFADHAPGSILAAETLRPSDAALIQPSHFAGVITAEGGADGHTAVMLRALGLPAILGATGVLDAAKPGTIAIIDGETGEIVLNPSAHSLHAARARLASRARTQRALARL